jgi:hypothetical protein
MRAPKGGLRVRCPRLCSRSPLSTLLTIHTYGSGQAMIGTLLMLFFGLPSMTRSL